MALKDWKKEKLPKNLSKIREVFTNKKTKKILVIERKKIGKYFGRKEIVYAVTYGLTEEYSNVRERTFKSKLPSLAKKQALAFAKAYMRTH